LGITAVFVVILVALPIVCFTFRVATATDFNGLPAGFSGEIRDGSGEGESTSTTFDPVLATLLVIDRVFAPGLVTLVLGFFLGGILIYRIY